MLVFFCIHNYLVFSPVFIVFLKKYNLTPYHFIPSLACSVLQGVQQKKAISATLQHTQN